MKPVEDAAYAMAALSATLVLLRALVKKGLLTRDEAVSQAIQAEAHQQPGSDASRQCAEMLKLIAGRL